MNDLVGVEGQVPVDLAGRDVVEPGHAVAAGRLGQGLGAQHVGPEEPGRVQDGQAVVGLGGEVDDDVDLVLGQGLGHHLEVADVALDEGDPVLDVGQVGPVAGVGEHVEGHDGVVGVVLHPVPDEVRADETGTAGHEESHDPGMLLMAGHRASGRARGRTRVQACAGPGGRTWTTSPATTVRRRPSTSTTRWPSPVVSTASALEVRSGQLDPHGRPTVVHRRPEALGLPGPACRRLEIVPPGPERPEQGGQHLGPVHRVTDLLAQRSGRTGHTLGKVLVVPRPVHVDPDADHDRTDRGIGTGPASASRPRPALRPVSPVRGHQVVRPLDPRLQRRPPSSTASAAASATTALARCRCSAGSAGRSRTESNRLVPSGASHRRPRRPRPALWWSATATTPSGAPRRASSRR